MMENPKHKLSTAPESSEKPSKLAKTEWYSDEEGDESKDQRESDNSSIVNQPMNKNPRIQRYLVALEYIGTRFSGSQQQPNCRTVVGVLEEAFHKFIGQPVSIFCSSRTCFGGHLDSPSHTRAVSLCMQQEPIYYRSQDAGVHALSNVCHVDVERISKRRPGEELPPHEPAVVRRAVNHFLQKSEGDIMVTDVRSVPADFHARYKACERTYFYRILSGPEPLSTFEKDRAWHVAEDLDLWAMQEACKVLVGHHDFTSFRAAGCQANSPIRTLDELSVSEFISSPCFPSITDKREPIQNGGDLDERTNGGTDTGFGIRRKHRCLVVTARARSFLYHQVRLLVGVLKSVGTVDLTLGDVERILNAKDVTQASPMAPACGLYLGHVKYDLPCVYP